MREASSLRSAAWQTTLLPAASVVLAAFAAGWLLVATPHGLGVTSDSVAYLGGAENLLAGDGFSRLSGAGTLEPLTHFPPFYSLVLAGVGGVGVNLVAGARWLNAVLLGLLVGGVVLVGRRVGMGVVASAAAGVAAAVSPVFFEVSGWVMSEPLFLVLGFLGLLHLEEGLRKPSRARFLAAGALVGLAYLTRYIGITFVLAGLARILMVPDRSPQERRMALAFFLVGSLAPIIFWLGRNFLLTGTFTNRTLSWHPLTITKWKSPLQLLWTWILPLKFTALALQITLSALGLSAIALVWRNRGRARKTVARLVDRTRRGGLGAGLGVFTAVYSLGVLVSLLWLDASTPVDQRIAAPVYFALLILAVWGGDRLWQSAGKRQRASILAVGIVILGGYVGRTWILAREYQRDGQGYASEAWRQSGTILAVQSLPASILLYTNNPEAVYFLTGRGAYGLPQPFDSVTGRPVPGFPERLAAVQAALASSDGAVIVFRSPGSEGEIVALSLLLEALQPYYEGTDGTVRVSVSDHG